MPPKPFGPQDQLEIALNKGGDYKFANDITITRKLTAGRANPAFDIITSVIDLNGHTLILPTEQCLQLTRVDDTFVDNSPQETGKILVTATGTDPNQNARKITAQARHHMHVLPRPALYAPKATFGHRGPINHPKNSVLYAPALPFCLSRTYKTPLFRTLIGPNRQNSGSKDVNLFAIQ